MKKKPLISRLFYVINVIITLFTLLGYLATYVSPIDFWPLAFLGLGLPYLLVTNLVFLFYWIIRFKRYFLLPLIVLLLGYGNWAKFIQIRFGSEKKVSTDLKIMSFNVRVFDLYMWSEEKTTRNQILNFLKKEDPDVLCLQEFYHTDIQNPRYEFKTLDTLVKILTAKQYHVYYTTTKRNIDHWGLITFSKYPIKNKGLVEFELKGDNACIYSDLQVNEQTVRVYNTHLASIKLEKHDYKAMQRINENEYSSGFGKELELLGKIKYGFMRRASQAEAIKESITKSPYPVVVCGDFNDTPSSYAYKTIKGELKDAFMESGLGLGQTYIGEFPSFRIDYIFYDDSLTAKRYNTHKVKLSDHRPVSALLSFAE